VRTHTSLRGWKLTGLLTALLLTATPVACRKPAQPSEEYTQARTRFSKLYAEKGDSAFLAPEMAEVDSLLARVPADSMDAPAAQELRVRIQTGRQQILTQEKAKNDVLARLRASSESPADFNTAPRSAPPSSEPTGEPATEATDAGTDAGTGGVPGIGTPVTQLASGFSGCFQKREPLEVRGRGLRDRWELADRAACRQQYASLQDQALIVEEGKVLALVSKSAIQALPSDGGSPPGGR